MDMDKKIIRQIVLKRLLSTFGEHGSQRKMADAIDRSPGFLSQLMNGHRGITETMARYIEKMLTIPEFSLDDIEYRKDLENPVESVNLPIDSVDNRPYYDAAQRYDRRKEVIREVKLTPLQEDEGGMLLKIVVDHCKISDPNLVGMLTIIMESSSLPELFVGQMLQKRVTEFNAVAQVRSESKTDKKETNNH